MRFGNKPSKNNGNGSTSGKIDSRSHSDAGHDESNWLVSYADMMTLLCGFFILLFSMAKLDAPEYDSFKEAVSKQFGGEYVSPTKDLVKAVTEVVKKLGLDSSTVIKSDSSSVTVAFESTTFFDTLSAEISPQGRKTINTMIDGIMTHQGSSGKNYKIVVEGHTDARPIVGGLYPSNWELSGARAARVVRLFLDRGFTPDHLTAIGYADTHPQGIARTPSGGWDSNALAKNRRVVLRILEPRVDAIPFPDDAKPVAQAVVKPGEKLGEKSVEKATEKSAEKAPDKQTAKPVAKSVSNPEVQLKDVEVSFSYLEAAAAKRVAKPVFRPANTAH